MTWILNNIVGIVGILVGAFIAYHVYFLSERLGLRDRLAWRDGVRKRVEPILDKIRQGRNCDVEIINVKKYPKAYLSANTKNRHGYTYLKGELKTLTYDGVECFCAVKEIYRTPKGTLSLKDGSGYVRENENALMAGIIPYEWIEYVDAHGDEFSYRPQFFTRFKGKDKEPYKYYSYYQRSDAYRQGDPMDMQWRRIDVIT